MKEHRPAMKDFTTITELLENVRGGIEGTDGGYCSTDPLVNAANGRGRDVCPFQPGSSGVGW